MSKLVTIDGKATNWCGLWWHPEYNGFSSEAINLSELKKFKGHVRLYVRKNKFYNNGQNNRPNYNFCLKDASSNNPKELTINDIEEDEDDIEEKERLYTREEVEKVMREACIDGQNGYDPYDLLIEDYIY